VRRTRVLAGVDFFPERLKEGFFLVLVAKGLVGEVGGENGCAMQPVSARLVRQGVPSKSNPIRGRWTEVFTEIRRSLEIG